jgi:hypothetical protein
LDIHSLFLFGELPAVKLSNQILFIKLVVMGTVTKQAEERRQRYNDNEIFAA